MKNYEISILNQLIDSYEKSKLSKEGSKRNLKISIKWNHPILKDYWSDESYLYKKQIDIVLNNLSNLNFIKLELSKDQELDTIILVVDKIYEIYHFLQRSNPEMHRIEAINYLDSIETTNDVIKSFKLKMVEKLQNYQNVSYFDSLENLKLYINAVEAAMLLDEDTLKRNFSKKVFNNSKTFETIEKKVIKIIRDFSELDIEDDDELLRSLHIVKTPTFAYIKGGLVIKVKNQLIDLSRYGHELALSSNAMLDLEIVEIFSKKVITIENLTTFVSFNSVDYTVIYLGGFHNNVKRILLKKIKEHDSKTKFYHFGDIDVGGILIFMDLEAKTGIEFAPYMMDEVTLQRYKSNWIELTQKEVRKLIKINDERFETLIRFMINNNCKLEQEAISL